MTICENADLNRVAIVVPEQQPDVSEELSVESLLRNCGEEDESVERAFFLPNPGKHETLCFVILLEQTNHVTKYSKVTIRDAVVFRAHYASLRFCFRYYGKEKKLELEVFRDFLSVHEKIGFEYAEQESFSEDEQEELLAHYQEITGEAQESLSMISLLFDTGMANNADFKNSCQTIKDAIAKCHSKKNIFFSISKLDDAGMMNPVLIDGRSVSADTRAVNREIDRLSIGNDRTAPNPFDTVFQTLQQIQKLPSAQVTYGVLLISDYLHFSFDTLGRLQEALKKMEQTWFFSMPRMPDASGNGYQSNKICTNFMMFLMNTDMIAEQTAVDEPELESNQPKPEKKPAVLLTKRGQPKAEQKPEQPISPKADTATGAQQNPEPVKAVGISKKSEKPEKNQKPEEPKMPAKPKEPVRPGKPKKTEQSMKWTDALKFMIMGVVLCIVVGGAGIVISQVLKQNSSTDDLTADNFEDTKTPGPREEDGHVVPVYTDRDETVGFSEAPEEYDMEIQTSPEEPYTEVQLPPETTAGVNAVRYGDYTVIMGKCTWEEAEALCVKNGGHLASVHSEEDWNAILQAITSAKTYNPDLKYLWLGGTSELQGNLLRFTWTDQTDTSYLNSCSHWYYNSRTGLSEPSGYDADTGKREPYLLMWTIASGDSEWSLNDVYDVSDVLQYTSGNMGFVMEYPLTSGSSSASAVTEPALTQPPPTEAVELNPNFKYAEASSTRAEIRTSSKTYRYDAANVLSTDQNICWVEGTEGDGLGETITVYADSPQTIKSICIYNGLCDSQDYFYRNNRVNQCRITFDDGSSFETELSGEWSSRAKRLILIEPIESQSVTLEILSVFPGNGDEHDTAITGIYISAE